MAAEEPVLYFVRHGETVWNRHLRLQGRLDSPLTLRGLALCRRYGEVLRERIPAPERAVVHTSPLGRARQTAALLAETLGSDPLAVREDPLLAELDVGVFAGRSWAEIEGDLGIRRSDATAWGYRPEGGESRREMQERARAWLGREREAGVHVVVSHGGMSRVFRAAYLGLADARALSLPPHGHGRLYRLTNGRCEEIEAPAGEARPEAALG